MSAVVNTDPIPPQDLQLAAKRILARSRLDENGCLVWTGCTNRDGYGRIRVCGKIHLVHRVMYAAFIAEPGYLYVCHSCDTPACVNPSHFFAGTQSENVHDMYSKERVSRSGEGNGRAKLKTRDVLNIRRRYTPYSKHHNGPALAKEFGISQWHVYSIINRETWGHI